jgi:hypothetical protein
MQQVEILKLFSEFGILAGFAIMFMWFMLKRMRDSDEQAQERELRIAERVTSLETFIKGNLIEMVEKSTYTLSQTSLVLERAGQALMKAERQSERTHEAMAQLFAELKSRPCLVPTTTRE